MIFNSQGAAKIPQSPRSNSAGATSGTALTKIELALECGFDLQVRGGDAATILSFGQIHMHRDIIDKPEVQNLVVKAQQEILDDLLKIRPTRVFVEGLYENLTSMGSKDEKHSTMRENILKIFGEYRAGQELSSSQENLLLNSFAPAIYLFLATDNSENVSILSTTTERHSQWVNQAHSMRPWDMSVAMGDRESIAMGMVRRALDEQEGTVALIYGAGHLPNWPIACGPAFQPTIYSKDYSKSFQLFIQASKQNPEPGHLPLSFGFEKAKIAFDRLMDPNSWLDKTSSESRQMLEHLIEALGCFPGNLLHPAPGLLISYVIDVNVDDGMRKKMIDALVARLSVSHPQERGDILDAFSSASLLPNLMSDSRVRCAVLRHKILMTLPIEKDLAAAIVAEALLLPDFEARIVLGALDWRGFSTTYEVERAAIDAALKLARDYERMRPSF